MKKLLLLFILGVIVSQPLLAFAQEGELVMDKVETVKAKVLEVEKQEVKNVPGTDVTSNYQTIKVQILQGTEKDKVITVENDYLSLRTECAK